MHVTKNRHPDRHRQAERERERESQRLTNRQRQTERQRQTPKRKRGRGENQAQEGEPRAPGGKWFVSGGSKNGPISNTPKMLRLISIAGTYKIYNEEEE